VLYPNVRSFASVLATRAVVRERRRHGRRGFRHVRARFLPHAGTDVSAYEGFQSQPDRLLQCYFNLALNSKKLGKRILGAKAKQTAEAIFEKHYPFLFQLCFRSNLQPFEWQMEMSAQTAQEHLRKLELYSPGVTALLARTNRTVTRADEQSWHGVLESCHLVP
jgi:hypothetical protein